jgi:hypothetical protein
MHAARRSKLVLWVAALALVAACRAPSGSPRAAAEAFLDAHYVRIDLEAARPFCVGLALDKLEKEIALLANNAEAAAVERPRVTYSLEQGDDTAERAQYAYDLVVHPSGMDAFHKLVVLSLRKENGEWRVSNYSESDR